MKRILSGLALICLAVPAAATEAVSMRFACSGSPDDKSHSLELRGQWDLVMDVGGIPSFGLLSAGQSGQLAGSIALNAGVAVVRTRSLKGKTVAMAVVTGESNFLFDGNLASERRRMCETGTYHSGRRLEVVAQRRPDWRSAQRAAER